MIRCLYRAGVRHFDCASLAEVELVHSLCPEAACYFMVPVSLSGRTDFNGHFSDRIIELTDSSA